MSQHALSLEAKTPVSSFVRPEGLCRTMMMPSLSGRAGGWTFVLRIGASLENIKPNMMICDSREIVTAAEDEEVRRSESSRF